MRFLRGKVNNLTGVPEDDQRLVFAGKQMEDIFLATEETATLQDYNIQNNSTVFLLARLKGGLQLKIQYDSEEKKVDISNDATVSDLKEYLKGNKSFP